MNTQCPTFVTILRRVNKNILKIVIVWKWVCRMFYFHSILGQFYPFFCAEKKKKKLRMHGATQLKHSMFGMFCGAATAVSRQSFICGGFAGHEEKSPWLVAGCRKWRMPFQANRSLREATSSPHSLRSGLLSRRPPLPFNLPTWKYIFFNAVLQVEGHSNSWKKEIYLGRIMMHAEVQVFW